jgi:hypothetical protein
LILFYNANHASSCTFVSVLCIDLFRHCYVSTAGLVVPTLLLDSSRRQYFESFVNTAHESTYSNPRVASIPVPSRPSRRVDTHAIEILVDI